MDISKAIARIPDHVRFSPEGKEAVILNLKSKKYLELDEIGTRMFQLLFEHGCVSKIIAPLRDEYGFTEDQVREDLVDLLAELQEKGLAEISDQ